jgi:hypothetical protein
MIGYVILCSPLAPGGARTCNPVIRSQMALATIAPRKGRILSVKKEGDLESQPIVR